MERSPLSAVKEKAAAAAHEAKEDKEAKQKAEAKEEDVQAVQTAGATKKGTEPAKGADAPEGNNQVQRQEIAGKAERLILHTIDKTEHEKQVRHLHLLPLLQG